MTARGEYGSHCACFWQIQAQCQKNCGSKNFSITIDIFFYKAVQKFCINFGDSSWPNRVKNEISEDKSAAWDSTLQWWFCASGFFLICIKISYFRDATFRSTLIAFGPVESYSGKNGCIASKKTTALRWSLSFWGRLVIVLLRIVQRES